MDRWCGLAGFNRDALFQHIQVEMDQLEMNLVSVIRSDDRLLTRLNEHTFSNPGKRIRPALLFFLARMLNYRGPLAVTYATVFELIHTATLIHDDVIDEASTRRGKRTLNRDMGNTLTVLYGDLLYTKANLLAISAGRLDVLTLIASVTEKMVEGELFQEQWNFRMDISEEKYFEILTCKTAYLFAGATKTAAILAGCDPDQQQALYHYGFNLGVSFQLVDDYLDYSGEERKLGKPVLSDLREGKLTLPVIRLLSKKRAEYEKAITDFWEHKDRPFDPGLLSELQTGEDLQDTLSLGREYAEKAVACLDSFPSSTHRDILRQVPIQLIQRQR